MRLSPLHLRGNHVPVHPGHLIVENHRVHRMRAEQPQSFGSTGRLQDFIAVVFEQHLAADELTPLVVNAENCCFQPRDHCLYISSSARVGFFYRRTSARGSRSCVVKWWRTDWTTAGTCFQNYERPLGCQLPGRNGTPNDSRRRISLTIL